MTDERSADGPGSDASTNDAATPDGTNGADDAADLNGAAASDEPNAIRGRVPTSPEWIPVRDRNNDAARRLQAGDVAAASTLLHEAIALTDGRTEAEPRDLRARALVNLAAALEYEGDLIGSLDRIDEAIATASTVLDETGDERATRTVLVNALLARAQTLALADRLAEALAQVDEARTVLDAHEVAQADLLRFSAHNSRTGLLIILGRLQDAEIEARRSLEAALQVDPKLAAHPYANLAAIAQRTGDDDAAREFVELAGLAQQHGGDLVGRQLAVENRARNAFQDGRWEEASELFQEAVELADAAGLTLRRTASRVGGLGVYLQTGNPVLAARELRRVIGELGETDGVHERREAYGFLGDAESKRGRFSQADEAYRAARALTRSPHERCRVDLRRAEMHAEWASFTPAPGRRRARLHLALETAIPVLLATEAMRADFSAGPVRERWSMTVAAPARELTFRLALMLGEAEVLFALIENAAASATLQAEVLEAGLPSEHGAGLPAPMIEMFAPADGAVEELPAAASGFAGDVAMTSPVRFAPPPRVIGIPGGEPALEKWIRIAEAEYGVAVRSDVAVAAW